MRFKSLMFEETMRIIKFSSINALCNCLNEFPSNSDEIIQSVINDANWFDILIKDIHDFLRAAKKLPKYFNLILQEVLNNSENFKRIFKDIYDLETVINRLPDYEGLLSQKIISDPELWFKYAINKYSCVHKNYRILFKVIKEFPDYGTQFVIKIFNEPYLFKKFICDDYHLFEILTKCKKLAFIHTIIKPHYPYRGDDYYLKKYKIDKEEVDKDISILKQSLRTATGFFKNLPLELIASIIAFTIKRNTKIERDEQIKKELIPKNKFKRNTCVKINEFKTLSGLRLVHVLPDYKNNLKSEMTTINDYHLFNKKNKEGKKHQTIFISELPSCPRL